MFRNHHEAGDGGKHFPTGVLQDVKLTNKSVYRGGVKEAFVARTNGAFIVVFELTSEKSTRTRLKLKYQFNTKYNLIQCRLAYFS